MSGARNKAQVTLGKGKEAKTDRHDMPAKSMRKAAAGIKDAQQDNQQSASKILRNGQLFIIHEGKEYNATGFRTR